MNRSFLTTLKIQWVEFKKLSVIILVLVNMVPIAGILFWGWKVFPIIFLFWTENLMIGMFNVIKMLFWAPRQTNQWKYKARVIPFFCIHYGVFALVHGLLILVIFGGLFTGGNPTPGFPEITSSLKNRESIWDIPVTIMSQLASGLANYISSSISDIWSNLNVSWGVAALAISHGVSLIVNYFGKSEYLKGDLNQLMRQPYGRVIILHFVILIGGFLVMIMGSQVIGLVLLVALKTYVDLLAHLKQHDLLQLNSEP